MARQTQTLRNVGLIFNNYALWVVRAFHPRNLGLASEINTYIDAHPEDAGNFVSLYHEIYALGAFAYGGLRNSDGSPKPALEAWISFGEPINPDNNVVYARPGVGEKGVQGVINGILHGGTFAVY